MAFLRQCLFEARQRSGEEQAYDGNLASSCGEAWHLGGHPEPVFGTEHREAPAAATDQQRWSESHGYNA